MAATPEHIRLAVLADVAAGAKQREAAERHGVPVGTVGAWCKREADKAKGRKPPPKKRKKATVEPKEAKPPLTPPRARARDALGPALSADIRSATRDLASFVATSARIARSHAEGMPEPNTKPPDMKQVSLAASALTTIAVNLADVVAVDERLAAKTEDTEVSTALTARIQATIARRHATVEPSELIAIDGGKSETG